MNFLTLQQRVFRHTGYADAPVAAVSTRVQQLLNEWHRRLLSLPGMEQLRDDTITFASVASTARYALPQVVGEVKTIFETTNDIKLEQRTMAWYRTADPDPQSGTSYIWIPRGLFPVASQPGTTGVWVVSSSGSDTTQTANIIGIRTGGYLNEPAVATLNGTTRVAVGTLTDYIEIVEFNISAVGVGTISLYDAAAAGTELARIPIGATAAQYLHVVLYPTPSSVITYSVDYKRRILDMGRDTDVPLLPEDFHYLLSTAVLMEEMKLKDDSRWRIYDGELREGIKNLYHAVQIPADYLPVPGQFDTPSISNLGPWYPKGRW